MQKSKKLNAVWKKMNIFRIYEKTLSFSEKANL